MEMLEITLISLSLAKSLHSGLLQTPLTDYLLLMGQQGHVLSPYRNVPGRRSQSLLRLSHPLL